MEQKEFDTWYDIFKSYDENITESEMEYILWNETAYPFAPTEYVLSQIKEYFKSELKSIK